MIVEELKAKIDILTELNERLKQRVAEAGLPTLEHHWENKCREHLAEVKALREKCKRLETEQGLHVLRKELGKVQWEVAKLRDQRERDRAAIARGEFELQRVLGASDIESAIGAADRVMAERR